MIRRLAPLLSLSLVLGACGAPTATVEPFAMAEPFWIELGTTRVGDDASTAVRFARVVEDSRCPGGDIACIWEGRAIVEVGIRVGAGEEVLVQADLMHGTRVASSPLLGRAVEFLELNGAPAGQWPSPDFRYRLRLKVWAVR